MTTLSSKLYNVTTRLQQLTVWRPNEHDPFIELDRWRNNAHELIEEFYENKRQEIENLIAKHEREFMRQIARQRTLLESLRKRSATLEQMHSHLRTSTETSILSDIQKLEREISTKLGRGEISVESKSIEIDDLVTIHLKTYLANNSTMFYEEIPSRNGSSSKTIARRSADENTRAYKSWLQNKNTRKQSNQWEKEAKERALETRQQRLIRCQQAFEEWSTRKRDEGAFKKKKILPDQTFIEETRSIPEIIHS